MPMLTLGCCQGGDCHVLNDEFGRPNSTDLGSDWIEKSGDWSIEDGHLKEAGNSGALVISRAHNPNEYQYVKVTLSEEKQMADGAKIRIIVNCTDDGGAYYCAEIGKSSSSLKSGGGVLDSYDAGWGTIRVFEVCINRAGSLSCSVVQEGEEQPWLHACVEIIEGGRRAGLGNGSNEAIYVDEFDFQKHYDTDPTCPWCCCHRCADNCMPETLTIEAQSDECSMNEGELIKPFPEVNRQCARWEIMNWPIFYEEGTSCDPPASVNAWLECQWPNDASAFVLTISGHGIEEDELQALPDSTCDPLYLHFESSAFELNFEEPVCCEEQGSTVEFIVTEPEE